MKPLAPPLDGAPDAQDDGREIDPSMGTLLGEGSLQQVRSRSAEKPHPMPAARESSLADEGSYFGLPMLKAPVWKASIPTYFYVGGLAGASAALGAAAQLRGDPRLRDLIARARLVAMGGAMVSAVLLIEDLGRPSRFLYMLRVFRPSSPMNMGSWILSAFGAFSAGAVLLPGEAGEACGLGAGLSGLPLAGYTAVLLAGTAVPTWQGAHKTLPFLFLSSAATSAASLLALFDLGTRSRRTVKRLAVGAKLAELAAASATEREVAQVPRVAEAWKRGVAGALLRAAKAMLLASLALDVLGRGERARKWGAWLGTGASVATRFGVFRAGVASAADARATVAQQRALAAS